MSQPPDLEQITQRIVQRFHPRRIILFGSRARGTASPDSDVDLFIEADMEGSPPQRAVRVRELFGLRTWSMDLIVYTPAEVRQARGRRGGLLSRIEAEGKTLYEHQ